MRRANFFLSGLALTALLLGATSASADYGMTGEWYSNRGPTVNIPPGKFDSPCGPAISYNVPPLSATRVEAPCVRHQKHGIPTFAVPGVALAQNVQSGVPAAPQIVSATTNTPNVVGQTFRVAPGLFRRQQLSVVPVPANANVQQLDTSFIHYGPGPSRLITQATVSQGYAGLGQRLPIATATRVLQKEAWNKVGQTARLNRDFNWQETSGGTITRRVTYTAGPNAYGGTMSMILDGEGIVWVGPLDLVAQVPGLEVLRSPIGTPAPGYRPQHDGRGYLTTQQRTGMAGRLYAQYNIPVPCTVQVPPTPLNCDLFSFVSVLLGYNPPKTTGGGYGGPLPHTTNVGFPFTTGHVSVYANGSAGGFPQTTTLTAVGNDTVSPGGVRTIQLVAGGTSLRASASGISRGTQLDTVTISLPEPGTTAMFAGAFAVLGGLFAARRRLF